MLRDEDGRGGFGAVVREATTKPRRRKGAAASSRGSVMGDAPDAEPRFDIDSPWLKGKDVEKLRAIREQLSQSTKTTTEIKTSLADFDHKLTDLEKLVQPIQDETRLLKNAHVNIKRSVASMESVLAHFRSAAEAAPTLRGEGLQQAESYNAYLQQVDRVKASLDYFRGPAASFKSAPEAVSELQGLYDHAMRECLEEFTRILRGESARPLDLSDEGELGPRTALEVWRHEALAHMRLLCPRLQANGGGQLQQMYAQVRGEWMVLTLESAVGEELHSAEQLTKAAQRYRRGSHPLLAYTDLCLRLLQAEQAVVEAMFGDAAVAEAVFGSTCAPPITQLVERARDVVELRQLAGGRGHAIEPPSAVADQMFVALDLYAHFERQGAAFEAALRGGERRVADHHIAQVGDAMEGFHAKARQCFGGFLRSLQDAGEWDQSKSENATVHEMTTTALSFARRLLGYTEVLEGEALRPLLLAAVDGDQAAASVPGVLRAAIDTAKEMMLAHASRCYDKVAGPPAAGGGVRLSALFSLNNLVYISRSVRDEPKLGRVLGEECIAELKQQRRKLVSQFTAARWEPVAQLLRSATEDEAAGKWGQNPAGLKKELKACFKAVNAQFTRGAPASNTGPAKKIFLACARFVRAVG